MKKALAYSEHAHQFRTDIGQPSKRFYLGSDAHIAQKRKESLVAFWGRCGAEGWTEENIDLARKISRGETIQIKNTGNEVAYLQRQERILRKVPMGAAPIQTTVTEVDLANAENQILAKRVDELETIIKEKLGSGTVTGATVSVHQALDEYHAYRQHTEIDPDTHQPTEHARTEGNTIRLVKRLVAENMHLSNLTYLEIEKWCKSLAARPISIKTKLPIKRATVKNALKCIRAFIKWAGRNYGWKRPDDWHDATLVNPRRTVAERREDIAAIEKYYTIEELGVLWRYALPIERLLLLLGLNFGYAQSEIMGMLKEDIMGNETVALRTKTGSVGKWIVWPETRALATEWEHLPARHQHIATKWGQLLERVYASGQARPRN